MELIDIRKQSELSAENQHKKSSIMLVVGNKEPELAGIAFHNSDKVPKVVKLEDIRDYDDDVDYLCIY